MWTWEAAAGARQAARPDAAGTTFDAELTGTAHASLPSRRRRQHQQKPAQLRQERPKQQPQHRKVIGAGLDCAPAHPRHKLREIARLRSSLGDNLGHRMDLVGFQFGDLRLTDPAGNGFAVTGPAGFVPLSPGHIERMVGRPKPSVCWSALAVALIGRNHARPR